MTTSRPVLRSAYGLWLSGARRFTGDDATEVNAAACVVLVAVFAPTALAVRMADAGGISRVAIARADGLDVFTHPQRFATGLAAQGAVDVA